MALLGSESFDTETVASRVFNTQVGTCTISSGNSLNPTGNGVGFSQNVSGMRFLNAAKSGLCACAHVKTGAAGFGSLLGFALTTQNANNNGGNQSVIQLVQQPNGSLAVYRGTGTGTLLAQTNAIPGFVNNRHHVGVKAILSATVGAVAIQLDGQTILTATGLNTGAVLTVDAVFCGDTRNNGISTVIVDDWVWNDLLGTDNNDLLGVCRVWGSSAAADGQFTGGTRGGTNTGSNHGQVGDATTADDDTTYLDDGATINTRGSYTFGSAPFSTGSVLGVVEKFRSRQAAAGTSAIAPTSSRPSGGTDVVGTGLLQGTSYVTYNDQVWERDPNATLFTPTTAYNNEFGWKRTL